MAETLAVAALKAAVVLSLILFFGQRLMRGWFHVVARQRSAELFMLNVLLITLGLAYLTELAGLSLALGAFVAGMLISETEYRYQVEEDIKPFRDVLLGLFFVTVGMMLDVGVIVRQLLGVLACWRCCWLQVRIIAGLSRAFGAEPGTSCAPACGCAQAANSASCCSPHITRLPVLPGAVLQVVLAAMVLSMLMAPLSS